MLVILPMAGRAKRFEDAGFILPKPLIEINGKPMIQYVIDNFRGLDMSIKFMPIVLKDHVEKFHIDSVLKQLIPENQLLQIVVRDSVSGGAAETVLEPLLADTDIIRPFWDSKLCISNCDQYINWNAVDFSNKVKRDRDSHWILTFRSVSPKWSYVRLSSGLVTEVAEKNPISNIATVGIYFYKSIRDFVWGAQRMIEKNIRVNGEFYICPVFNQLIERGDSIRIYDVEMYGLGTPEDFENNKFKLPV